MNDLKIKVEADHSNICPSCNCASRSKHTKYLDSLSSEDRHSFRGDWAILEGSIENALIMLNNSDSESADAKKALKSATQSLGKIKKMLM